jgi:hypothetical protein
MLFGSKALQVQTRKGWMSKTGFDDWSARHPGSGYQLATADIDGDQVPDMVVRDSDGKVVSVNGVMLKRSKLPAHFKNDNFLERQAVLTSAFNTMYKGTISDLKKAFRVKAKPHYDRVVGRFDSDQIAQIHKGAPLAKVAKMIMEDQILGHLDARIGDYYGKPYGTPQEKARLRNTRVYRESLKAAFEVEESDWDKNIKAVIKLIAKGEITEHAGSLSKKFEDARGPKPAKVAEIVKAWNGLSPQLKEPLVILVKLVNGGQDTGAVLAELAREQGQPTADAVSQLIPLGKAAARMNAPDFLQ